MDWSPPGAEDHTGETVVSSSVWEMLGVEPTIGVVNPPKWMVYFMENPMNKWMIWVVFPLFLVQQPCWFMLTSYLPGKLSSPYMVVVVREQPPQNAHRYLAMLEIIPLEDLRIRVIHKDLLSQWLTF